MYTKQILLVHNESAAEISVVDHFLVLKVCAVEGLSLPKFSLDPSLDVS